MGRIQVLVPRNGMEWYIWVIHSITTFLILTVTYKLSASYITKGIYG
jgi:hypothetical protein